MSLIVASDDTHWMGVALAEAHAAARAGEVPVGALVVQDGRILGRGRNAVEANQDPTAHAEMLAITAACASRQERRLQGAVLYVTLEPCPMCLGAALLARLDKIVYAAPEPKFGACGSRVDLTAIPGFNHHLSTTAGVRADESSELLRSFFRTLRERGN